MGAEHNLAKGVIAMRQMEEKLLPSFYGQKMDSRNQIKTFLKVSSLCDWLNKKGFRLYREDVVKIKENIVSSINEKEMYRAALDYVKVFDDESITSDFMTKGASLLLNQKGTVLGLEDLNENFLRSTKDNAYFFFNNGVVQVTISGVELIPYSETKGYIWKEKIIEKNFDINEKENFKESMFYKFLVKVTDNEKHYLSLVTSLGYLMHRYKSPTNVKAVIVNDISLATDGSAEGGTGKGLSMKAVGKLVNVTTLDGKKFGSSPEKFAMQNVTLQTDVIYIDDADRSLKFEQFFSSLSENLEIEKKHKDTFQIPYKDSPKMAMTTNYAVKGVSSSHLRRKQDVFINGYYSHAHSPYDDFGCEFFHDWNESEWQKFYALMLNCVQSFQKNGLVEYSTTELKDKMLRNQTNEEFWEAMQSDFGKLNTRHSKSGLRGSMVMANPSLSSISDKRIKTYLNMYADHKGLVCEHISGTGNVSMYILKESDSMNKTPEELFVQEGEDGLDF